MDTHISPHIFMCGDMPTNKSAVPTRKATAFSARGLVFENETGNAVTNGKSIQIDDSVVKSIKEYEQSGGTQ